MMNEQPTANSQQVTTNWQMIRTMGGIGLLCAILIVFTHQLTLPVIARNKAEALQRAVFNVLPGAESKKVFRLTSEGDFELLAAEDGSSGEQLAYAGYDAGGDLIGIALEARGQGFQDAITLIYGYSAEKQAVIGIQVLESKETPGLGDKIEKDPAFLQNFEALSVALTADKTQIAMPIAPVKKGEKIEPSQIECITGATISSKAISNILQASTGEMIPALVNNLDSFRIKD